MTRQTLTLLLVVLCIIGGHTTSQSLPDHPRGGNQLIAVSIEEIKAYGVVTYGRKGCDDFSSVAVFSDPDLTERIGSIASHSFVRYDRLSELTHKPYWAPRREDALPDGEKFRIYQDSISGWIDDEELMTFSSVWRERNSGKYIAIAQNTVVIVHTSGQYESAGCAILSVWERQNNQQTWLLSATVSDPIAVGLYVVPAIDRVVRYNRNRLAIQMSAFGGDAEDVWGTFAFYLYHENELTLAFSRPHSYSYDRDYVRLESELSLDEAGEPVALMIQKHFAVGDPETIGYPSTPVAVDTTAVMLLNPGEQR